MAGCSNLVRRSRSVLPGRVMRVTLGQDLPGCLHASPLAGSQQFVDAGAAGRGGGSALLGPASPLPTHRPRAAGRSGSSSDRRSFYRDFPRNVTTVQRLLPATAAERWLKGICVLVFLSFQARLTIGVKWRACARQMSSATLVRETAVRAHRNNRASNCSCLACAQNVGQAAADERTDTPQGPSWAAQSRGPAQRQSRSGRRTRPHADFTATDSHFREHAGPAEWELRGLPE